VDEELVAAARRASEAHDAAAAAVDRAAIAHEHSADLHEQAAELFAKRARHERRHGLRESANRADVQSALASDRAEMQRNAADSARQRSVDAQGEADQNDVVR
jgi:hypothetical protein